MDHFRVVLAIMLIAGLIGCQSIERPVTISEYKPASPAAAKKAPDSRVFELVRWTPIAPVVAATQTTQPVKPLAKHPRQMTYEIEQVYVDRGKPIGFRRADGQLIAVAGATTMPLQEAHYAWKTMPTHPSAQSENAARFLNAVGTVVVVVVVAAIVLWILHQDRHNLLDCDNN